MLVYWTGEDYMSVVAFSCTADPCPPVVDKACQVEIGRSYKGMTCEDWYVCTVL